MAPAPRPLHLKQKPTSVTPLTLFLLSQIARMHSVEVLEARIAPALLFVSGAVSGQTALHVVDESGHAVDDASAAAIAGATAAVVLHAGDKLIFDPDYNHRISPGDATIVKVTAGSAMVFLTNGRADIHRFE